LHSTTCLTSLHPYGVPSCPLVGANPRVRPLQPTCLPFIIARSSFLTALPFCLVDGHFLVAGEHFFCGGRTFLCCGRTHGSAPTPLHPSPCPLGGNQQKRRPEGRLALIVLAVIQQPNKGDYSLPTSQFSGMPLSLLMSQFTLLPAALMNVPSSATPLNQLEVWVPELIPEVARHVT